MVIGDKWHGTGRRNVFSVVYAVEGARRSIFHCFSFGSPSDSPKAITDAFIWNKIELRAVWNRIGQKVKRAKTKPVPFHSWSSQVSMCINKVHDNCWPNVTVVDANWTQRKTWIKRYWFIGSRERLQPLLYLKKVYILVDFTVFGSLLAVSTFQSTSVFYFKAKAARFLSSPF